MDKGKNVSILKQRKVETTSLIVSAIINIIMAAAGIWVYVITGLQVLFLDGVFSGIACLSNIFAVIISNVSKKKTKSYPDGIYFLEPFYAIFKSLLTLTILIISVISTAQVAYRYFAFGEGELINTAPVLPYVIAMLLLCFGLGIFNMLQNKRIGNVSTMLNAEWKSNMIDGVLSGGCGVGVLILDIIDINGKLGFLHYTGDFFITIILVLLSIYQPSKVLFSSFKELSGGKISNKVIKNTVGQVIKNNLQSISGKYEYHIFKIGLLIKIRIDITKEFSSIAEFDFYIAREKIINELHQTYDSVNLVYQF